MYDQLEGFDTRLNLDRKDVHDATQDPRAYNLTDEDMQFMAYKVGLTIVGGMTWWDAIRAVFDGMMS